MPKSSNLLIADASGRIVNLDGSNLTPKQVTKEVSTSFNKCIEFFEEDMRETAYTYYCLARFFDEIEDSQLSKEERKKMFDDFFGFLQGEGIKRYGNFQGLVGTLAPTVKDPRRKIMVENFEGVIKSFNSLDEIVKSQAIECLNEMRYGMKTYLDKGIVSMKDLSEYCYYVAGTVGLFLNQAMRAKRGEKGIPDNNLARSFGTFLQIVNILRGIQGDLKEGRFYLPSKQEMSDGSFKEVFPGINITEVLNKLGEAGDLEIKKLRERKGGKKIKDSDERDAYTKALGVLSDSESGALAFGRDGLIYEATKHLLNATKYIFSLSPERHRDYQKFLIVAAADGSKRLEKMHGNLEMFVQGGEIEYPTLEKALIYYVTKYLTDSERRFRRKRVKPHLEYVLSTGRKIVA